MNRSNIWIRVMIVGIAVTFAAVIGQIDRLRSSLRPAIQETSNLDRHPRKPKRPKLEGDPEVLVRFKPGVSLDTIRQIALRSNDRIEDEVESVNGLVAVDDLDDADPVTVAEQYAAMSDQVLYAEPNFEIRLEPQQDTASARDLLSRQPVGIPN